MGKRQRSIESQFRYVIESSRCFGRSKYVDRQKGIDTESKIYSYNTNHNMVDIAKDFGSYMKEHHKDIKQVCDINETHVQDYIDHKANTCNQNTLNQIYSRIRKLEAMAKKVYKYSDVNFGLSKINKNVAIRTDKMRSIAMDEGHYKEIIKTDVDSDWKRATQLSHEFGLRVSEACKLRPQDLRENSIYVFQSKGGRSRNIKIETSGQRMLVAELKQYAKKNRMSDTETIIKAKSDSINRGLRERAKKLGYSQYTEAKTGMHSVRKNYCIREYDKELEAWENNNGKWESKGINMEVWDIVSNKIGHGEGRHELAHAYLCR